MATSLARYGTPVADLVPIVDLGGPDATRELDEACRTIGFFSIIGHGVDPTTVQTMLAATDGFFALPLDVKLGYRSPGPHINRGYAAKGTEGLTYSLGVAGRPPDLFEAFNVGPEPAPPDLASRPEFAPNIWPADPASLRPALLVYFQEVVALCHRITRLLALALDVDEWFFEDKTDHSTNTIRVNHYERSPGERDPLEGQQRMGAHTDYGIITVLYADPVPGLQIVGPGGRWYDVQPAGGALLCNLGDLLAEWTNDRWRSTLHRVVPPPRSQTGPAVRRSVAFFHDGNFDAVIRCLPTCCSAQNPARYPPVVAGEHLMAKLQGPRTLTRSAATDTAGSRLDTAGG
jgi:isopenicillin N synthase-like dioxygenase